MTNAQLEHVVLVQARELEAQRAQIDRLILERDRLADRIEHQRTEWRRGYQAGHAAACRKIRDVNTNRAGDAVNVPALATEG